MSALSSAPTERRDERFLTVAQTAARLNVAGGTVRKWIRQGKLASVQLYTGGAQRVPQSEIHRLVHEAELDSFDREIDAS
jgi:excisionase family DNA binding protein